MEANNTQFNYFGETELMQRPKTVFFCPFDVPNDTFKYIREWVASLDPSQGVIVCGNCTGIERFTLRLLLGKGFSVILPLATTIPANHEELNIGWKLINAETSGMIDKALDEHRLLLVSSVDNVSVSSPTRKTFLVRDEWMRSVGERFVVAARREFDYYDRLLLGKQVSYLSELSAESISSETDQLTLQQENLRMGWSIYRMLKEEDLTTEALNAMLMRYLQLDIEHPSLLHSLIMTIVISNYSERADFDYPSFLKAWSIRNLRPEDWKAYRRVDGKLLPSLADRCLSHLFHRMPSRNLMSIDYGRTFDKQLAHEWLDAAMKHSPRNMRHVKKALRLAYYEHDSDRISYYKQLLDVNESNAPVKLVTAS